MRSTDCRGFALFLRNLRLVASSPSGLGKSGILSLAPGLPITLLQTELRTSNSAGLWSNGEAIILVPFFDVLKRTSTDQE
jgi:hypothetical protein